MDRTAIVTGGTGGLGSAVVERLLEESWRVVVPWVAEQELERLAPREGLELVRADLFDPAAVKEVVAAAGGASAPPAAGGASAPPAAGGAGAPPLRGLVNLVGGYAAGGRLHETTLEGFERLLRLNLRATYLMTQAAVAQMLGQGGGSIVCVGARAALLPFSGAAGYISSKAAVIAFAQAVAAEYRDDGIRCNVILPSVIDTPANRASMPGADHGKWVKPEEIAPVIAHLLSEESEPVSGAAIPVYGRA